MKGRLLNLLIPPKAKRLYELNKELGEAEKSSDYRRACRIQKYIINVYTGG